MDAYCFRCGTKREIRNPQSAITANGRPAIVGTCPVCEMRIYRMGKRFETRVERTESRVVLRASHTPE